MASVTRPSAFLAFLSFLLGCDHEPHAPDTWLSPTVVIAPEQTEALGAITAIDVRDCTIAAADWMDRRVWILRRGLREMTGLGRRGDGPGEFQHPRLVALGPDFLVSVFDWQRRRLIQYSSSGILVRDTALHGGVAGHGPMGRILATDSIILDFWMADPVAWQIPGDELDSLPLVSALAADGGELDVGWGSPLRSVQRDAVELPMALQSGDIAVKDDSLFVLRNVPGVIEVYPLNAPSREPTRTIHLMRYRPYSSLGSPMRRRDSRGAWFSWSCPPTRSTSTVPADSTSSRDWVLATTGPELRGPLK